MCPAISFGWQVSSRTQRGKIVRKQHLYELVHKQHLYDDDVLL